MGTSVPNPSRESPQEAQEIRFGFHIHARCNQILH